MIQQVRKEKRRRKQSFVMTSSHMESSLLPIDIKSSIKMFQEAIEENNLPKRKFSRKSII